MDHNRCYYSLEQAKRYKSTTRPYPFIIAHECREEYRDKTTGDMKIRNRKFYAFDDVETFIFQQRSYPYAHEVIFDRFSERQQGRLIFDFDFEVPWYSLTSFVPPNFEKEIERMVIQTFQRFYVEVNTDILRFVWLRSNTTDKWSKHLIVKNAYFIQDWKEQCSIFYNLMLGIIKENQNSEASPFKGIDASKLIDIQVARSNATMRICGSMKYGKDNVLVLEDSNSFNIYDTFVQQYRRCDIDTEQMIEDKQLLRKTLNDMFYNPAHELMMSNQFYKQACHVADIDLSKMKMHQGMEELKDETVKHAFECFEIYYKEVYPQTYVPYRVKSVMNGMINLERVCAGKCLLSGRIHESENAFMIVTPGGSIYFYCRRGCSMGDKSFIKIYEPKTYAFAITIDE